MALRADGSVATWGENSPENPAGLTNVFTISVGGDFCAALTGNGAPRFTIQPASQAATNGATVRLHARVVGVQPMAYRWVKDGVTLPGETNTDLTIASARLEDSGDYALIVVNPFETARSASARLTVFTSPIITLQPAAQTGIAGANVTLMAAATGTMPLSYQWLFKGAPIPGATWTTLALSDIQSGQSGYYSLLASNVHGMAESSGALLTVLESPPYIFTQPTNCTATFGSAVTLSVNARGSMPLGYQWCLKNAEITGATGKKLTLLSARLSDAGFYTVTISNAFGEIVSAQAKLTVQPVAVWGPYSNWPLPPNTPPSFPPSLTDPVAIAGSRYYVLGLNSNGTAVVSRNRPGIPIGYIPTSVPEGLSNIAAVAAGRAHCLALQSNGTVQAWGLIDRANPYWSAHNATNVPANLSKVVGVAAGDQHSLALKQDGAVVSWGLIQGYSSSGAWVTPSPATNVPAGLSNVISVAAGGNQNLALRSDGTVRAWGGGMNVPTGLSNVIAVACGEGVGVALKSDGKVVAWLSSTAALSSRPPLATNVPPGLSNVVAIAAGATGRYAMALQTDGTVVTWGSSNVLTPAGLTNVFSITVGTDFFAALVGDGSPHFTIQPASQAVAKGTNVRLHARAVGIQPLSYQWQLEGVPISGATNASLTLTNLQGRNAGKYRAVVTNALGEAVSAAAVVSIPFNTNLAAALNATNLVWTTDPTNALWFVQNRETHDGDVAAQSGAIGPRQQTTLHAAVVGPGTLTFWWKVSSEEDYDRLWFSMDALNWATWISGETDWRQFTYHVPAGSHVLRWAYTKDESVNEGADAGWLDEVVFTPTAPVKLSAPERLADGTLALSCADVNGHPFTPQDRKHFGMEASSNLVDWLALPDAFTWTNGLLQLHDPTEAGQPQRYYRVIAR